MKEHELRWHEECKTTENHAIGICLGLLCSSIVRFAISGSLPPVDGSPRNKTDEQIWQLLGVSLGLGLPVMAMTAMCNALEKHKGKLPGFVRAVHAAQELLTQSMGWCLLFCGQWGFWSATHGEGVGLGDKMSARMVCALVTSYVGFVLIYLLDWIADRMKSARAGFDAVIRALILGIAISWKAAFKKAVQGISHEFDDATTRTYVDVGLCLFICSVVVPAWVMYMLPKELAGPVPLEKKKPPAAEETHEACADSQEDRAGEDGAFDRGIATPDAIDAQAQVDAETQGNAEAWPTQGAGGTAGATTSASAAPSIVAPGRRSSGGKGAAAGGKGGQPRQSDDNADRGGDVHHDVGETVDF